MLINLPGISDSKGVHFAFLFFVLLKMLAVKKINYCKNLDRKVLNTLKKQDGYRVTKFDLYILHEVNNFNNVLFILLILYEKMKMI